MSDAKDKLRALLATGNLMTGAKFRAKADEDRRLRESGVYEVDRVLCGAVEGSEEDGFFLVREDFPLETPHGDTTLGAALAATAENVAFSALDEELGAFDPRTAVFVDTETTGLMGGAGTVAFLVGVGYFTEDSFRLDQCFMRDYDDEEPMLNFLGDRFRAAETVVSYNGKSFDVPLLRTRFISNRIPFRLEGLMHYDLVHAARRLWKKRLGDCSLGNVERHVLALQRVGDVNSALIPQLWLDYLHSRDARPLQPVFYHHRMDILSLAALTARMSESLTLPEGAGFDHVEDRLSLVRLHFRKKQYDDVLALANGVLETTDTPALRRECFEMAAMAAKRRSLWDVMEDHWNGLLNESPHHLTALAEMAKHCEHRKRDLPAAAACCERALEHLRMRRAMARGVDVPGGAEDFRRRLERIQRKLAGATGPGDDLSDETERDVD